MHACDASLRLPYISPGASSPPGLENLARRLTPPSSRPALRGKKRKPTVSHGELGVGDGRERRVQAQVPGAQGEADLPVHHVQDQRAVAAGGGGPGGAARRDLRRLHRHHPRRRVPLRRLRLRLRHRRELPEEQDLLHLLVPGHVQGEEQDAVRQLQGQVQEGAGRLPGGAAGHRPQRDDIGHRQGQSPLNNFSSHRPFQTPWPPAGSTSCPT
ncbi:hypothetical protein ACQJBY_017326 [Aegilops geniculata]